MQRLALEIDQAGDEAERLGAVPQEELARAFAALDAEWGIVPADTLRTGRS